MDKSSPADALEHIAFLSDNDSIILDVGCGDGSVAKMMMEINPSLKIIGIDIQSYKPAKIPREIYDGETIPYPDNSFDIVTVLDVLHHFSQLPTTLLIYPDDTLFAFFAPALQRFAWLNTMPYSTSFAH